MEKRISDRGYYPVRLTRDEVDAWAADPSLVDARFKAVMLDNVERWMALGDERLAGTGIRCIVSPANDDIFEMDPIIERAELARAGRGRTPSSSTASRSSRPATPTRRRGTPSASCPSPSCASGSTGSSRQVPDPHRAIFNFHAPPYGSNLDNAPKLDADMNYVSGGQALIPVGSGRSASRSSRTARRSRSTATSTRARARSSSAPPWRSIPGSSYEDGVLQAAIVDLDTKKGTVKRYLLING